MDNLTTQLCIKSAIREIEKHCKTSPNVVSLKHVAESIREQEKYAELGRLVAESPDGVCHKTHYNEKWSGCRQCRSLKACQKRAELLGES
jgi:hypothetical protein